MRLTRCPLPAEIVRQAHAACRVSFHRMYAAVRGARADGLQIGAERRPVTLGFVGFAGNRSLDHQDERLHVAAGCAEERLEEFVAVAGIEKRIMEPDVRNPRESRSPGAYTWIDPLS